MPRLRSGLVQSVTLTAAVTALTAALAGCGGDSGSDSSPAQGDAKAKGTVDVGALSNGAAKEATVAVPEVAAIRARLPKDLVKRGELVIGSGNLPSGSPPLGFVGDDQRTLAGSEPDLGRLVAAVFGLKPVVKKATWDNLFVGIDSGRTDVGFSNITDTEQRKEKYDFACYRQDSLGFEVSRSSKLNFDRTYKSLAGKVVAVTAGTNQEKILLHWRDQLKAEGKPLAVKYFQENNSTYLALNSGKIDAYSGPNPSVAYHTVQTANTPQGPAARASSPVRAPTFRG